ncbi:hypothetical protein LTR56_025207 [Elasticomyces elasticus]|nr:hypothetical protein LTR56_025207 [Elasticomyces elasticus]KAK5740192.1 hypothetical protein LTS12_025023 [Elasticomyces elasticus]
MANPASKSPTMTAKDLHVVALRGSTLSSLVNQVTKWRLGNNEQIAPYGGPDCLQVPGLSETYSRYLYNPVEKMRKRWQQW